MRKTITKSVNHTWLNEELHFQSCGKMNGMNDLKRWKTQYKLFNQISDLALIPTEEWNELCLNQSM